MGKSHLHCVPSVTYATKLIFYESDRIKCLWSDLVQYFQNSLVLPTLTLPTAIFRFLDSTNSDSKFLKNKLLMNHILLIFKLHVLAHSLVVSDLRSETKGSRFESAR